MMKAATHPLSSPLEGEPNPQGGFGGGYVPRHIHYARRMRTAMTSWEFKLWQQIRQKQIAGCKFRRQQPIAGYIVDFYNAEHRLVIELDGSGYCDSVADRERDAVLTRLGYRVLRFWSNEIDGNMEGVLMRILECVEAPPHGSPAAHPLPLEGGAESRGNA